MANTIAQAWGTDKSGRVKETHRLGSEEAKVCAATWQTKAYALVNKDGSGEVAVYRDGKLIHTYSFGPEE